jgi:hypothetical protein
MEKFSKQIENLLVSTGYFVSEYAQFLDGLDLEQKQVFISELRECILTNHYKRIIQPKGFGLDFESKRGNFRYSEQDLKDAEKAKPLHTEKLLPVIEEDNYIFKLFNSFSTHVVYLPILL